MLCCYFTRFSDRRGKVSSAEQSDTTLKKYIVNCWVVFLESMVWVFFLKRRRRLHFKRTSRTLYGSPSSSKTKCCYLRL